MTKVEPIIPKLNNSWSAPLYPDQGRQYQLFVENAKDTPLFGETQPSSPVRVQGAIKLKSQDVNYDSPQRRKKRALGEQKPRMAINIESEDSKFSQVPKSSLYSNSAFQARQEKSEERA